MMSNVILVLMSIVSLNAVAFDHTYKGWNTVLSKYVIKNEKNNYFKYLDLKNAMADNQVFENVLKDFSAVTQKEYDTWSREQKLAFLFNTYNAFTVKIILKNHSIKKPLESIKDIGSLLTNTWKIKFFRFLGDNSNLDHIEHDLARKEFDEPRLHMAFNCASRGCPNLRSKAFVADQLELQLENAAKEFINNKTKNYYDKDSNTLYLSSIFKWYADDFEKSKRYSSVRNFVASYISTDEISKAKVLSQATKIKYIDYDWRLNELR